MVAAYADKEQQLQRLQVLCVWKGFISRTVNVGGVEQRWRSIQHSALLRAASQWKHSGTNYFKQAAISRSGEHWSSGSRAAVFTWSTSGHGGDTPGPCCTPGGGSRHSPAGCRWHWGFEGPQSPPGWQIQTGRRRPGSRQPCRAAPPLEPDPDRMTPSCGEVGEQTCSLYPGDWIPRVTRGLYSLQ